MNEELTARKELDQMIPEVVSRDNRTGYQGFLVAPDHLVQAINVIKNKLQFDYLSCVTCVDYISEGFFEIVYIFYRSTGGGSLELKTRVPRENPDVPSIVSLFPGSEFQEREVYDMFGVRFSGHPDLRRILMWEGYEGWPLRKDFREPFAEDEVKPFKSRWPEGYVVRAEEKNPYGDNLQFPKEFNPDAWIPEGDEAVYKTLKRIPNKGELATDRMIINLGPQHPSTHGVFRMVAALEGETIIGLKPVVGYLHRNHEKIGERNTFLGNMPFTDRLDYISSMSNNFGYAVAVEKLMGLQPTERAEYLRVIMAELTRIVSHLISIGFLLNDLGAFFTPSLYSLEERELIIDIFEAVSGSRMMCNYFRFGGVARDLPEGIEKKIREIVFSRLPRKIDDIDKYLTRNEIVRMRCEGVGILKPDEAIAFSAGGPVLRASGVPYDVRKAEPYSIYERFDFDVMYGIHGDVYDRYLVRLGEIRQSIKILQQAMDSLPEGPILNGKPQHTVRVPVGESYGRVEGPKGELGYYVVSNGKPNPYRYHVRPPSFINLTGLESMAIGGKVADAVTILGSLDIVLGEVDR